MAEDTSIGSAPVGRGADIRTFLFADMRGYTRYTRDHGDEAASAVASRFAAIVRGTVPAFEGELLELRGDEALCVFGSSRQALRAAVALQRRLRAPVEGEQVFPLGVGIGLDAGEAVPTEGGYRGSALNLAARLCGQAGAGDILATERLVGLAGPLTGLHWDRPRGIRLKGVQEPERIVEIQPDESIPPPPAPRPDRVAGKSRRRLLVAGMVAILVVGAAILAVSQRGGNRKAATSVPVRSQSLAVIDPAHQRVTADVRLAAAPESIVIGGRYAWVGAQGGTVVPVSLAGLKPHQPVGVEIDPANLAYGDGAVWVFDAQNRLAEIDAQRLSPIGRSKVLWRCVVVAGNPPGKTPCAAAGMAFVDGQVWIGNDTGLKFDHGTVERIDPNSRKIVGAVANGDAGSLAAGEGQVWLLGGVGQDVRLISVSQGRVVQSWPLGVSAAAYTGGGIAQSSGLGWATAPSAGKLIGFAPGQGQAQYVWTVPRGLTCIATGDGSIWLGVGDGRVLQVNPFTGHWQTYRLGHTPVAITYSARRVWVVLA